MAEIGIVFGDYELETYIGRGGMADVFRARALCGPWRGETVAVKRLLPEIMGIPAFARAFIREASLCKSLLHPHIIKIYETGRVGDQLFMAMEYICGRDLRAIVAKCREREILLPVDFVCFVVDTVAHALHYAHNLSAEDGSALGLVHCDVTPANVFVSSLGEIKLGDFGVARTHAGAAFEDGVSGNPAFLAPELIMGETPSPSSDVFSLSVMFYELLTNRQPFSGATVRELFDCIVQGKIVAVNRIRADVPAGVCEIVRRGLSARLPARASKGLFDGLSRKLMGEPRYATTRALADDLRAQYDPAIGNPLAMAAVVRNLFGTAAPVDARDM